MKRSGERIAISEHGVGVPPRQEVIFHDGSTVWLLRVQKNGSPDLFRRRVGLADAGVEIDLRTVEPELETDLPIAATRDVPGIVHYSLRRHFKSAAAFVAAATGAAA